LAVSDRKGRNVNIRRGSGRFSQGILGEVAMGDCSFKMRDSRLDGGVQGNYRTENGRDSIKRRISL